MDIYAKPNDSPYHKWVFDVFYIKTRVKIGEIHLSLHGWKFHREPDLPDYLMTRPIKNPYIIKLCILRGLKPMDIRTLRIWQC